MRKKTGLIMIISGTVLIISALLLCIYNIYQDNKSGEKSQEILAELKSFVQSRQTVNQQDKDYNDYYEEILNQSDITENTMQNNSSVSEKEINGNSYVGYITIDSIGLELPVMTQWSYNSLEYCPCVYSGTAMDNNLIIAAHNYSSHFRSISRLNSGDIIYFTDIDGNVYEYRTSYTELINGNDAASLLRDDDNSWDLTLFTCTMDGRNRVTVRAVKSNYE